MINANYFLYDNKHMMLGDKYSLQKKNKYTLSKDKYALPKDKYTLPKDKYALPKDKYALTKDDNLFHYTMFKS